jgi:hypothetical protein
MLDGLAHGLLANPGPGGQFAYRDALSGHEHQGLGVPGRMSRSPRRAGLRDELA